MKLDKYISHQIEEKKTPKQILKHPTFTCEECGQEKELKNPKRKQKFCTRKCYTNSQRANMKIIKKLIQEGIDDIEVAQKVGASVSSVQRIRTQELKIYRYHSIPPTTIREDKARMLLAFVLRKLYEKHRFKRKDLEKLSGLRHATIIKLLDESRGKTQEAKKEEGEK